MNTRFWAASPAAAGVLVAAVVSLSACSGEPASSESSGTASESVQAAPKTVEVTATATSTPTGTIINTSKGSYLQVKVPDIVIDPAIIHADTFAHFDAAEIESGTDFLIDFMVKQGIDSPANGGGQTIDAWFAENQNLIAPRYREQFLSELHAAKSSSGALIITEGWHAEYGGAYQYIYSTSVPRIRDLSITPTLVWAAVDSMPAALSIEANVSYTMEAVPGVGKTGTGQQVTTGTLAYSASRSPETGQWQIAGWQHDFDTIEG